MLTAPFFTDQNYLWGSNIGKSHSGVNFYNLITYGLDSANHTHYKNAAQGYVHYMHGVNPLNIVYLINMYAHESESSCNEIYHGWFADGSDFDNALTSLYGPPPGYVPGGPNGAFAPDAAYGGTISPPQNQPVQKAYKDWNTGWPENSWEITEPSITCQGAYVKLLSKFVSGESCPPPTNVSRAPVTPNSAKLNWNAQPEADHFQIRGKNMNGSNWVYLNIPNASTDFKDVFGLSNNATYVWQIRSFCDAIETDSSDWSALDTFTTGCFSPDTLWTDPITSSGARLNWVQVTGAAGYEIKGQPIGSSGWTNLLVNGGSTVSKDVFRLLSNTGYQWKIRTWCNSTGSAKSGYSGLDSFWTASGSRLGDKAGLEGWRNGVKVFPNPASGTISITLSIDDGDFSIEVVNYLGQMVLFKRNAQQINLANQPAGIYCLFVKTGEYVMENKIVIE